MGILKIYVGIAKKKKEKRRKKKKNLQQTHNSRRFVYWSGKENLKKN